MSNQTILWIIFGAIVPLVLILDLGLFSRGGREIKIKEALILSGVWISLALLYNLLVYFLLGSNVALEFLTGYIIEESLSVDNLFVFLVIFSYFGVQLRNQHKVLVWGILGVVILRGIFIFVGVELIERLHWLIYVFGAFLVFTGVKLAFQKEREFDPQKNSALKLLRKLIPVSKDYVGNKFFAKEAGKLFATPLLAVLVVIETTDVVFAVDSIPAVLAITQNPFVVFTSNIFAVLGLRAIFFALSGCMELFCYLNYGLSVILSFVGVKMLLADIYKMPIGIALGVVGAILASSIVASLIWPKKVTSEQ